MSPSTDHFLNTRTLLILGLALQIQYASAEKRELEAYGYKIAAYELPGSSDDDVLSDFEVFSYDDSEAQTPVELPGLAYRTNDDERAEWAPRGISVKLSKRFTIVKAPKGKLLTHPRLTNLNNGELLLRVSPDPDMFDEEQFILISKDGGKSWKEQDGWPMGDDRGRHLYQRHTLLPNGRSMVASTYLISTGKKDEYILPAWISDKDGKSNFKLQEPVPFHYPYGAVIDYTDREAWPAMIRGGARNHEEDFLTRPGKPSQLMNDFREKFGKYWLAGHMLPLYALDDKTTLAFVTSTPGYSFEPRVVQSTTVCLASTDQGRSWKVRSVPGPWDPELEEKNRRKKPLDGFVEPSITRLSNGDHFIVMRIGAWQRLYSAVSKDNCHTWSKPREISVFGIYPTVLTLPDGVLALCTGRPDNTLSFSFDNGYTWPWTLRILDQTLPEHPSTRNNTMIQVSPGRLLYMYDYGYRRPDPEVDVPHAIEGLFIDVSTTP